MNRRRAVPVAAAAAAAAVAAVVVNTCATQDHSVRHAQAASAFLTIFTPLFTHIYTPLFQHLFTPLFSHLFTPLFTGNLGLPYWNWSNVEVNGEVVPGIVREMLLKDYDPDFFPVAPSPPLRKLSVLVSDAKLKQYLVDAQIKDLAQSVMHSSAFVAFSNTAFQARQHPPDPPPPL